MDTIEKIDTPKNQEEDFGEIFGEILLTSMEAGHILLENGAEVFRVEVPFMF